MKKLIALFILFGVLYIKNGAAQNFAGGSYDGSATVIVNGCSAPSNLTMTGGSYDGSSTSIVNGCSAASSLTMVGGSFDGSSTTIVNGCSSPSNLTMAGGSYDGSATVIVNGCSAAPSALTMAGGSYDGSATVIVNGCSATSSLTMAGGSYDGSATVIVNGCSAAPSNLTMAGGSYDGSATVIVNGCSATSSLTMAGGSYDGSATVIVSGCSAAPSNLTMAGGSYDGSATVIVNVCSATSSLTMAGGSYDGYAAQILSCVSLSIASITAAATTCNQCNGTATVNPSGGIYPYKYQWSSGGATTDPATGLCSGTYTVTVTDAHFATVTASVSVGASSPCSIAFTVKFFIQGYYLGGGKMSPLLKLLGASSNPDAVDTVTIVLHNSSSPYAAIDSSKGILQSNDSLSCTFAGSSSGNYYIVIKDRNSLETWSNGAQTISSGGSYDFTTAATQAYGSNMVSLGGGKYGIYSGDINQDGSINGSDTSSLRAALSSFLIGVYNVNDITGDSFVDEDDYRIMQNNVPLGITVQRPH